jgi:2-polyprenyl-3-methyl-5-hydroxy-6-metoxy-1,4-benzoquinol methylase
MLKQLAQRIRVGRSTWDPVAYWRTRAKDPATMSVMWANFAYNDLVDRDEWNVIERQLPAHGAAVLDLGCGTGRMSERLAARFDSYTGVDLDTMVAEAARRYPALASQFVASTIQDYDYPKERFDFILSLGVLATACSKPMLPGLAGRIATALRPGGRLLLIEPFHENALLTRGCKTTTREAARLFEDLGMQLEEIDAMLFFPARFALGERLFGRFPNLTRQAYEVGERLVRLRPELLGDYGIIVLSKP